MHTNSTHPITLSGFDILQSVVQIRCFLKKIIIICDEHNNRDFDKLRAQHLKNSNSQVAGTLQKTLP
mgnify:CR=1 FL=1